MARLAAQIVGVGFLCCILAPIALVAADLPGVPALSHRRRLAISRRGGNINATPCNNSYAQVDATALQSAIIGSAQNFLKPVATPTAIGVGEQSGLVTLCTGALHDEFSNISGFSGRIAAFTTGYGYGPTLVDNNSDRFGRKRNGPGPDANQFPAFCGINPISGEPMPTADAAGLQMRLRSDVGGVISFNYLFASDEWPEYVGNYYRDGIRLMAGVTDKDGNEVVPLSNIALVPNPSGPGSVPDLVPVSIETINPLANQVLFRNNDPWPLPTLATEYDGFTTALRSLPIELSHGDILDITIIIADCYDGKLDSALLLPPVLFVAGASPDPQLPSPSPYAPAQPSPVPPSSSPATTSSSPAMPFSSPMASFSYPSPALPPPSPATPSPPLPSPSSSPAIPLSSPMASFSSPSPALPPPSPATPSPPLPSPSSSPTMRSSSPTASFSSPSPALPPPSPATPSPPLPLPSSSPSMPSSSPTASFSSPSPALPPPSPATPSPPLPSPSSSPAMPSSSPTASFSSPSPALPPPSPATPSPPLPSPSSSPSMPSSSPTASYSSPSPALPLPSPATPYPPLMPSPSPAGGQALGDPHLVGFDGSRFDFHGRVGGAFAMISEPSQQVNMLLDDFGISGTTFIKKIGFLHADGTWVLVESSPYARDGVWKADVLVYANGMLWASSEECVGDRAELVVSPNVTLSCWTAADGHVDVGIATDRLTTWVAKPAKQGSLHLNVQFQIIRALDWERVHGVLGQTLRWAGPGKTGGSGAFPRLEGEESNYQVADEFSTDFRYSQFEKT